MVPVFSSGLQRHQEAMIWEALKAIFALPPTWCLLHNGDTKNASKSDSWSGLSRMESVCAGEGFYQRQTLTGIPVWIVHPIPAFHRKLCIKSNWITPKDISFVASRLMGSTANEPQGFLFESTRSRALKESGSMEETHEPPVRRLVPMAAAQPARAHAPDEHILRG